VVHHFGSLLLERIDLLLDRRPARRARERSINKAILASRISRVRVTILAQAEDDQFDARPGPLDHRDQRRNTISGLNQELHVCFQSGPPPFRAGALY
jgi:hypothetical protein